VNVPGENFVLKRKSFKNNRTRLRLRLPRGKTRRKFLEMIIDDERGSRLERGWTGFPRYRT